ACYDSMNGKKSKNLATAEKINETANNRCVALCIETRPDVCEEEHIDRMLEFGTTRCELGVQALSDELYQTTRRGHTIKIVQEATARLKDNCMKVGYHWMPGLPGSDVDKDLEMYRELFTNQHYKPDHLKIYPTQIMQGTTLLEESKKTGWQTYQEEELIELLIKMKQITPRYCRIMRIMRAVPHTYLQGGIKHSDLRKILADKMHQQGKKCLCIRCRETGFAKKTKNIKEKLSLKTTTYEANNGTEHFLEYVNENDTLFALARLRQPGKPYRKEITKKTLLMRELHVYGPEVPLNEREDKAYQHHGLGKKLMIKTEEIANKEGCNKIVVISGIGVREYYRKFGYILEGPYMVKEI
ncbi:MAG: tRNA uridine(34) 5-carboxymethylaminomethyl modification radical SAM/GNAT enzyme Elp3, partial [Nanoarchaeota archaeon]|nr:tRNA uridine(34) 5-carboxymethylaminomethyl modification radical SAM/GNAT enzyme Elp3 [Nanoarchaeota archaeon]